MWISRSIVPCSMFATFCNVWLQVTLAGSCEMRNLQLRESLAACRVRWSRSARLPASAAALA